ncbi:MAG TPA: SGNH/GDSL hydrolase family protein, partial [Paludibacter sp.]|nr:SGNH/GDSL hydrolase family protein [Paludibacter sp.]
KQNNKRKVWTGSWTTAPQLVELHNMPPQPGLSNSTLRQIVRVSIGGDIVKLKFTNIFSNQNVEIKSAAIAVVKDGCAVDSTSQTLLKFRGKKNAVILPGADLFSDSIPFKLLGGSRIAITISFGETSPDITGHPASRTTSYILPGEHTLSAQFAGAVPTDHWYIINRLEVLTSKKGGAIVVLGNSIADGRGSGTNKQNRWPDILSERLLKNSKTKDCGVLNSGIGGNCVVRGGLGPTGLNRFVRDVLSQSNVKWVIISEGINDIGGIRTAEEAPKLVEDLIAAYSQLIDKAHAKGIKVYGATILPFAKSFYDKDFRQDARDKVNEWIRTSGRFDAVIDFDSKMRNPEDLRTILPNVHDGDFLHPNQLGYRTMGEFVDLKIFEN